MANENASLTSGQISPAQASGRTPSDISYQGYQLGISAHPGSLFVQGLRSTAPAYAGFSSETRNTTNTPFNLSAGQFSDGHAKQTYGGY
jgi:hypothetical protein